MRLTKQDKADLLRFGCTLQSGKGLLCIRWTDLGREQALAATILVRGIYKKCTAGPCLCLALEISPTSALAHYCYFPINLKNRAQRKYLCLLAQTGQLHLAFAAGGKIISRDHQLTLAQCKQLAILSSEALAAIQSCARYRFPDVVNEFEKTTRIPQFFERVVSDKEIAESLESLRVMAKQIPSERQVLAHHIVHGLADVLKNRYGDELRKLMVELQDGRKPILILFDFHREFGSDYERFVDFLTDCVAVNAKEESLRKASDWPSKLDSILKSFEQASTSPEEKKKINAQFTAAVSRALDLVSSGRGLSLSVLQNLVLPFRALLPGQPGRPTKDYSREYEWKASGMSWTEVARQHIQQNAEVRAEFGGRDFDLLTFEEKENLRNRIREGVRSHAERAGKSFPLPESSTPDEPVATQKT
jgi:hypothetical protein